ncbi:MAG: PEP-CTERM sorting domain-containing protein [Verrucomicrobiales bacterium]|jgi:hypothetical protein|nr:PEP-CTERM sorting domain-containing protein [Verrucomicrobiales bacterium]
MKTNHSQTAPAFPGHNLNLKLSVGLLACCVTLSALADSQSVTTGTLKESDQSYTDTSTDPALYVSGSETLYDGTDIILNASHGSFDDLDMTGKGAFVKNGATLLLTGGTVSTSGDNGHGVMLYNSGHATLTGVNINTTSHGLEIRVSSTATMTGGVIHTTGRHGTGVFLYDHGAITLTDVSILTTGEIGHGVDANNFSTLTMTGGTISVSEEMSKGIGLDGNSSGQVNGVTISTAGEDGHGVMVDGNSTLLLTDSAIHTTGGGYGIYLNASSGTVRDTNIQTSEWMAYGIFADYSSALTLTGGTVTTSGYSGHGVYLQHQGRATISDARVSTAGDNSHGVIARDASTLALAGDLITTSGNVSHGVYLYDRSGATLTDTQIETTGAGATGIMLAPVSGGIADMTLLIDGGAIHSAQDAALTINDVNRAVAASTLGNMNGHYTITIKGGAQLTGATAAINLDTAWRNTSGGITQVSTTAAIHVDEASTLAGDVRNTGLGNLTLNLTGGSTLTGNLIANGTTITVLNSSQGATITGDIIGSNEAAITISLTGPGTAFTGNITVSDYSAIDLTVGAGALLGGLGTHIDSLVTISDGGHLASTLTLTNGLTLETGAILDYYTTGALQITGGTLTIADGILVDFGSAALLGDQDYLIMDYSGATGSLNADYFTASGLGQDIQGNFILDNNQLLFHTEIIPEPSTWFLLGAGLGVWWLIVCYHRRQDDPTVPRSGSRRRGGSNGIFTR